jgi:hypothetical protein
MICHVVVIVAVILQRFRHAKAAILKVLHSGDGADERA